MADQGRQAVAGRELPQRQLAPNPVATWQLMPARRKKRFRPGLPAWCESHKVRHSRQEGGVRVGGEQRDLGLCRTLHWYWALDRRKLLTKLHAHSPLHSLHMCRIKKEVGGQGEGKRQRQVLKWVCVLRCRRHVARARHGHGHRHILSWI